MDARYKYTAFGEVRAVSIAGGAWTAEDWTSLPLAFTTQMLAGGRKQYFLDSETGLYLLGSGSNPGRCYDPSMGRFLSEEVAKDVAGAAKRFEPVT